MIQIGEKNCIYFEIAAIQIKAFHFSFSMFKFEILKQMFKNWNKMVFKIENKKNCVVFYDRKRCELKIPDLCKNILSFVGGADFVECLKWPQKITRAPSNPV